MSADLPFGSWKNGIFDKTGRQSTASPTNSLGIDCACMVPSIVVAGLVRWNILLALGGSNLVRCYSRGDGEGGIMSVMVLATYLLARAEAGEIKAARKGQHLTTLAELKPLLAELGKWGLETEVRPTLELLWQNGWLIEDASGQLRPTPAAHVWLQLPPAPAHRAWLEGGAGRNWLKLPLSPQLVTQLIEYGVVANVENEVILQRLALLGLVIKKAQRYQVLPATTALLTTLTHEIPISKLNDGDETVEFELAQGWEVSFPGQLPGKGWLRWHSNNAEFSFARPQVGQPFSFHPWQLFRLLSLCQPLASLDDKTPDNFHCQLDRNRLSAALAKGLDPRMFLTWAEEGLRGNIPRELAALLKTWLSEYQLLMVGNLTLLEAADRDLMSRLIADRTIRPYLKRLLSPRFAIIEGSTLKRLQVLLQRRQLYLQVDPSLLALSGSHSEAQMKLTRGQLQQLCVALNFYRWQLTALNENSSGTQRLIGLLEKNLTLAEREEAADLVSQLVSEIEASGQTPVPPKVAEEQLRRYLEQAIADEQAIWIEYYVPGRNVTKRQIEPLQIYEENEQVYVIAYCHLRKGERKFRLDRLRLPDSSN